MNSTPMVSVFVITYNSASYIKETLDSVKRQTYKNLELVISDDCSTDNTVEICRAWIEENRENFVRTELVSTPHNMGVAGNCNNAIRATTGVWLKGLSGDDKFLDYTIEEYVNYVNEHPECRICFAKLHFWGEDDNLTASAKSQYERYCYPYIQADIQQQKKRILRSMFVPGPGLFYQKSLWKEVGGFDERYPFAEEYPFTYNVLTAGNKIHFLDKELYAYQVRDGSLSKKNNNNGGSMISVKHFQDIYQHFLDVRRSEMLKHGYLLSALHESISLYNRSLSYKAASKKERIFAKVLFMLSPIFYWDRLSRKVLKRDSK